MSDIADALGSTKPYGAATSGPVNIDPYNTEDSRNNGNANPWGRATFGGQAAYKDPVTGAVTQSSAQSAADAYNTQAGQQVGRPGVQLQYGDANNNLQAANQSYGTAMGTTGAAAGSVLQGQQNQAQADQSRGYQTNALRLQQSAAQGKQPSQAQLLGQNQIDAGLKSQLAAGASSAGGPLAQMAAVRNAQGAAAQQTQQGANSLAALRANEMATARQQYSDAATNQRASDLNATDVATRQGTGLAGVAGVQSGIAGGQAGVGATEAGMAQAQSQADMNQRALNQNNEQFYGNLGYGVQEGEANRGVQANQMAENRFTQQSDQHQHAVDRGTNVLGSVIGGIGSLFGLSDMRAKTPVQIEAMPSRMGGSGGEQSFSNGLAMMSQQRSKGKEAPSFLDRFMARERAAPPPNKYEAWNQAQESRFTPEDQKAIDDDGYHSPSILIQHEDPYGSGQVFYSDADAKREVELDAFQRGMKYAGQKDRSLLPEMAGDTEAAERYPAGDQVMGKAAGQQHVLRNPKTWDEMKGNGRTPREAFVTPATHLSVQQPNPEGLTGIDPAARGIRVQQPAGPAPEWADPRRYDVGGGPTAQGRELPGTPMPSHVDPTGQGQKFSPFSYSDEDTKRPGGNVSPELQQDANRRGAGFGYAYKDEFTPPEQQKGEVNYGPSANELEKNPLTATAIKRAPNGYRMVDTNKLLKSNTAGIASLQHQIDELRHGAH